MYNSFYGLSFNPFDKQQLREKDHFVSNDFREMTNRLNYLKDIRGDRCVYRQTRYGKVLLPAMLCCKFESQPVPHGIPVPVHHQCG